MKIEFSKYHGTGNDFIMIDNRGLKFIPDQKKIESLCHRRFGIGADGLILIQHCDEADFEMIYFNADGGLGSMCGNGGRCAAAFARSIGISAKPFPSGRVGMGLKTADGIHEVIFQNENSDIVKLSMNDVKKIEQHENYFFINTGSPHYISFVNDVDTVDVITEGRKIRYSDPYKAVGTNVNFVEKNSDGIKIRTYERGVEDETLSCGTGVTASSLTASVMGFATAENFCNVETPGGKLKVYFSKSDEGFNNIHLEGAATFVYKGTIDL